MTPQTRTRTPLLSKQKNFMDYVPRRNKNYQYEVDKDGKVTILVKWTGPYHKIATVLFKNPEVSRIDLDAIGSWVWLAMDGHKTVYDLSKEFHAAFPDEEKPVARLAQFLKILHNNKFIVYNVPLKDE